MHTPTHAHTHTCTHTYTHMHTHTHAHTHIHTHMHTHTCTHTQDVLDTKNAAIKDLQYEVARMYKTYNDTVRTFQSKLGEYGIPVEELGFQLLNPDPDQPLGKAPAGLVASSTTAA